jgi:hypothetical protein
VIDARTRLPREPYPGLRPFLDFEAALLFGRERQVREVVDRLRLTQFVAVLGGSGSGKSSLIHAGVVPELRSFGIPGAGDLWLPLTCTPGTNVSAEDSAARRHSPITRLARRFAALLKSRGAEAADKARLNEIADVFRQEAGFARLLDTYGRELAVPPGPDPGEARVLFVLDQFEEIFHPTNKGVEDARLLVERVLDHFFNPHPHCHIVLTMRSEHLNDCAGFLELPDAINKSSYLIRRLDDGELRDAITGPAQRFLRLVARSEEGSPSPRALPSEVTFEPAVLDRVLRDVKAITQDPDHLPLLQHLLARLWKAALEREEMDVPVPGRIGEIDLVRAVAGGRAGVPGDEQPLAEGVNTLRECVENWPESIYRWHDPPQRVQLDALLRHLAFKDPNTGLYSQQRIDVDACAHLLGADKTRADLRALIAEGFLGSVDYLFWDEEDPSRVTLKVSHEAFIRGWSRFRQLVDEESLRFDGFVGVLRKCADWVASGRSEDFLLETGDMRRLRESDFESHLAQPEQRAVWFRFLLLDRDGARLCKLEPELDGFWATSSQRLRERERQLRRARRNWLLLGTMALLLALPSALFSVFVQGPVTLRAELLFDAGNRANRAPLTADHAGIGAAAAPLESLLRAAELIDQARRGQGPVTVRISEWLFRHFSWIPAVHRQDAFLTGVAAQAEPPVNGKLRQLLAMAVWHGAPRQADEAAFEMARVIDTSCLPPVRDSGTPPPRQGRLFVVAGAAAQASPRAIFVSQPLAARDAALALHSARWDAASGHCEFAPAGLRIPLEFDPHIVFDAALRYFAYTAEGRATQVPSVTLNEIDWERTDDDARHVMQSQTRAVVTSAQAVARVKAATGTERTAVAPSWRSTGGRSFEVGGEAWRLVAASAQRLPVAADDAHFAPLRPSPADGPCAQIRAGESAQPGFRNEMFEDAENCFAISRGNPDGEAAVEPDAAAREQVLVAVYARPDDDAIQHMADNPPAPIASLSQFARVAPQATDWRVGTAGPWAGWLALRAADAGGQMRLLGQPWSTCALWRLGRELVRHGAASAAAAPGGDERSCGEH